MNYALKFDVLDLQRELNYLGLILNLETGHLFYSPQFRPLQLDIELMVIRHGETYGNCGQSNAAGKIDHDVVRAGAKDKMKRVYQGNSDTEINQLTILGKLQAQHAAELLVDNYVAKGWVPDILFHSPLTRAKETGLPFVSRNNLDQSYFMHPGIREISFGAWENRRISDIDPHHICHSYYLEQNALVSESGVSANGIFQQGECFAELILTAHQVLNELAQDYSGKKIILFTHSMFGAACGVLFGKSSFVPTKQYIAFDGQTPSGQSHCLPHAKPIALNF